MDPCSIVSMGSFILVTWQGQKAKAVGVGAADADAVAAAAVRERSVGTRFFAGAWFTHATMIEVVLNDRLGKKIRVKCKCVVVVVA